MIELFDFDKSNRTVIEISEENYINKIAENRFDCPKYIAAAVTDFTIQIFDKESLTKTKSFKAHSNTISGIHFCHTTPEHLWSCSTDGFLKLWDLRTKAVKPSQQLKGSTDSVLKPLLSFDINLSDSVICAGTELIKEDAFLIFWDYRSSNLLGAYWESHVDDITDVKFHPSNENCLASGSTDSLINIFNIRETSETDALMDTFNTESSVDKLNWHLHKNQQDVISCTTHMDELQLWNVKECEVQKKYTKKDFQKLMKSEDSVDYLVETINVENQEIVAIVGNKKGICHLVHYKNQTLYPIGQLPDTHTQVVRCALWNDQDKILITGGEDGKLCIWNKSKCKDMEIDNVVQPMNNKMVSEIKEKTKSHKRKPY